MNKRKPTIEELEKILSGNFPEVRIEPNGELKIDCEGCPFKETHEPQGEIAKKTEKNVESCNNHRLSNDLSIIHDSIKRVFWCEKDCKAHSTCPLLKSPIANTLHSESKESTLRGKIAEMADNIEGFRDGGMPGDSVQSLWDGLRELLGIK